MNFIFGLGTYEILIIVAILFLLFGATRLPQLAKSLGQTRKAFREGMREAEEEERTEQEQKRLQNAQNVTNLNSASASELDDETLFEEARRRAAQIKQQ
ncbi:MAG: twin-arginine translocase TatA/TatE family subunit [Acidobacteriota bacterium]|nr:twin-arginine translocase TatA/TatE family subunit [Acidobacteriota bacterium]